jgi:DNA-binding NtrC family response regulator
MLQESIKKYLPKLENIVKLGAFKLLNVPYTPDLMQKVEQALEEAKKKRENRSTQDTSNNNNESDIISDDVIKELQEIERLVEHKPQEMFFVRNMISYN